MWISRLSSKWTVWLLWLVLTLSLLGFYSFQLLLADNKSALLLGETTHGHFQIELACDSCHSEAFTGPEGLQQACVACHGAELTAAHDSHPKSKFTDPRNADRIALLDARYCVSCHTEHKSELTREMGVTLPDDFCFHCHQQIAEERPSHQGMAFDTCASAGCHNFHDNRALYEDFLLKHATEPVLKPEPRLPKWAHSAWHFSEQIASLAAKPLQASALVAELQPDAPRELLNTASVHVLAWAASKHAQQGVNCTSCHTAETAVFAESAEIASAPSQWVAKPGPEACQGCHQQETQAYLQSKHGMRLAAELPPLTPAMSERLQFDHRSLDQQHSCQSCHHGHVFDVKRASVDACLDCHADQHTLAYVNSPHYALWLQEQAGTAPKGSGVTCATCHMPTEQPMPAGSEPVVQHNQSLTLRPNEKMIRPVCLHCHGLGFAIDALADSALIRRNFQGQPAKHIRSIDMAIERQQ